MTCNFSAVTEVVQREGRFARFRKTPQGGGPQCVDVHLDRMDCAASLENT